MENSYGDSRCEDDGLIGAEGTQIVTASTSYCRCRLIGTTDISQSPIELPCQPKPKSYPSTKF